MREDGSQTAPGGGPRWRQARGRILRTRAAVLCSSLAGLAAVALAWAAVPGVAHAAYRGSEGRIAFVRGGYIYTIEPGGTGLRRLTRDGADSGPRWSPNGTRIAYIDHGNLWIMRANGSHKRRVTHAAPGFTDARASWSPNGRYLAFVKTARHHASGFLTRYDTAAHRLVTFSTPFESEQPTTRQVKVTALPAAVAWTRATDPGSSPGYFILFEGAGTGEFCMPHYFCLDALGMGHQSQYRNGFPSAEDQTRRPTRLLDPDWFPINPEFDTQVLTTVESCRAGRCTHTGIMLSIVDPTSTILPGAYQAVYSPTGRRFAFVRNIRGNPEIYITLNDPPGAQRDAKLLTRGSQPDWQPVAPSPAPES